MPTTFILILISVTAAAASGGPADRSSLLSLAATISSDALANWGSPTLHFCNWTGVTCNPSHHRIVQLDLRGLGLTGVIAPAISNLTALKVLDLSDNDLHGLIPAGLSTLSRLTQLSLSSNLLSGPIPDGLGLLNHLVYLDLGSNHLSGSIPNSLFCNTSLQYIDLSNNSLSGNIPMDDDSVLPDLRFLLLWTNDLIGDIPRALANSTKLEWLDLESNFLTGGLPSRLFDRTPRLQFLYLSYNNLSALGDTNLDPFFRSLANCSRLEELELASNGFADELPPSIGELSGSLLQLHLDDNQLRGSIPHNIANLINLTYLNLSHNLLNGTIPPEISKMKRLQRVYLSNNMLIGEIPPSIGEIPPLGLLDLSVNRLSGRIPEAISGLSQLRRLMLHHNQLVGTIPPSLGNCVNLEILDLSYNRLTGRLPNDVAGLTSLKLYLNLSSNYLEGPLPLALSKMDMILALDLSLNNFTGVIPRQLGSCVALEYLNLSSNALEGSLPSSIGALPFLAVLDLSLNQLTGAMPESLQDSSTLKTLNLSFNNLSGVVPSEGVFASLPMESLLGNPGLCGGLISGMPTCSRKRVLHRSVIIPVLVCLIGCVCLVGCPIARRVGRRKSRLIIEDEEQIKHEYPKISYRQLVEATEGFSGSNLIGSGRFGHVYKGVLKGDNEMQIAVKVLDPKIGGEILVSFRRECEVLKRTRHRNLIRIVSAYSRPDFKAVVLPLMSNGSLEDHLYPPKGSGRLSLAQLVSIVSDISEGISYLHHYSHVKVIHCDLKPSNVLLDDDMTALVSDFGIAKLVKGGNDYETPGSSMCSTTGLLCGSIGYIPPEYGLGGHPTTQGDVYSFGVLVLEIITGTRPTNVMCHEGLNLHEWVKSHYPHNMKDILKSPMLLDNRKDIVSELIELGLVCTQYQPSMRPTMVDVAHEVALIKQALLPDNDSQANESSSSVPTTELSC